MRKLILFILAALFAVAVALPSQLLAAEGFSKDTMKRMGTFVSNFTELGMYNLPDAQNLPDEQYAEFGVMHEWLNNNSRFKMGKDGMASIEASHIENAVMRYFGKKITAHRSVPMGGGSWEIKYDPGTKRYTVPAADGEQRAYARVESAKKMPGGNIMMTGTLYVEEGDEDVSQGPFTAVARPHKWNGKDTWALLSLECPTRKPQEDAPEAQVAGSALSSRAGGRPALRVSAADLPSVYSPVIDAYRRALAEHWEEDGDKLEANGIPYEFRIGGEDPEIVAGLIDIDGDGSPELLIYDNHNRSTLWNAYTVKGGKVVRLFISSNRDRWNLMREDDDTYLFENEGSSGGTNSINFYYALKGGQLVFLRGVIYDEKSEQRLNGEYYETGDENKKVASAPYFTTTTDQRGRAEYVDLVPVTEADAKAITKAYDRRIIFPEGPPPKEGVANAICRIVVTDANVSVMDTPSPKGNVRFKASASAEYIAARYTTVCAGSNGDGSAWYELLGMYDPEDEKMAPSLAGRSAKGALLRAPLYISAKSVREIPLREGDAAAVSEMLQEMLQRRFAYYFEPENVVWKIAEALSRYVGRTALEAKVLQGNAVVSGVWDSDDPEEEFAHTYYLYTDTFYADTGASGAVYLAESGANIGGIVLGKSTMDEVRAIFGEEGSERDVDDERKDGFTIQKHNLSGGASIYDSEAPVQQRIPFKAVKQLDFEWISEGSGHGYIVTVFFDAYGRAVAMEQHTVGIR